MLLPTPNYKNPNPPSWFAQVRENTQAQMDAQYLHGPTDSIDAYDRAAKAWLDDQSKKREMSANPAAYRPEPFTRQIPRREIWDITEDGSMYTWFADADPNIHPPVLPPYVPPQATPNAGFKSTAGEAQAAANAKDAAVLAMLTQINGKLDRLLGAK